MRTRRSPRNQDRLWRAIGNDLARATKEDAMKAPQRELSDDTCTVYLGDNGRAFCGHHAGASAAFTGRDISGQRVVKAPEGIMCETCDAQTRREYGAR